MSAEEIHARYVAALVGHEPTEDVYLYCTCGERIPDGGYSRHMVDVLAAAGRLPDGEEWAVRYDMRRPTPSMEGARFDTSTLAVRSEGDARALIANRIPMGAEGRRVVSRPAFEWREASVDE